MRFFTYMILFPTGYLYTGSTGNLARRQAEHRRRIDPGAKVVFKRPFETREEALAMEKQIKGWTRAKKEALIEGNIDHLKVISKRRAGKNHRQL